MLSHDTTDFEGPEETGEVPSLNDIRKIMCEHVWEQIPIPYWFTQQQAEDAPRFVRCKKCGKESE